MANLNNLEEKVSRKKNSRRSVAIVAALVLVLGLGLIGTGVILTSGQISADVDTPPTPTDPQRGTPPTPTLPTKTQSEFPPVPEVPSDFTFSPGWSMISGQELYGYDLSSFRDAGLALYSYNDPKYPNRDWAITYGSTEECQTEKIGCDVITPQPPLGYYVYNSTGKDVNINLAPDETPSLTNVVYGRGWHVLYWTGDPVTKAELLKNINIEYTNGKKISALEATSNEEHKASIKIYSVVNENTIDLNQALKELGDDTTSSTISKIPKNSYFWVYFRRTSQRAVSLSLTAHSDITDNGGSNSGSVTVSEQSKIDAWLEKNNYNQCGDPMDTVYTGGSCLFDEATGQYKDKYELILSKYPNRPWL